MRYAIFCAREDRSLVDICTKHIQRADPEAKIDLLGAESPDTPLMIAKCEAWLQHSLTHEGMTVYLDDDVIVQRPLNPPADVDLILTTRDVEGLHPYNTGVLWGSDKAAPFFHEVLGHCQSLPDDRKDWYGDQDAVEAKASGFPHAEVPCDEWNWTPEHFGELRKELRERSKPVIHFKGQRKGWMRWYDREMEKVAA